MQRGVSIGQATWGTGTVGHRGTGTGTGYGYGVRVRGTGTGYGVRGTGMGYGCGVRVRVRGTGTGYGYGVRVRGTGTGYGVPMRTLEPHPYPYPSVPADLATHLAAHVPLNVLLNRARRGAGAGVPTYPGTRTHAPPYPYTLEPVPRTRTPLQSHHATNRALLLKFDNARTLNIVSESYLKDYTYPAL